MGNVKIHFINISKSDKDTDRIKLDNITQNQIISQDILDFTLFRDDIIFWSNNRINYAILQDNKYFITSNIDLNTINLMLNNYGDYIQNILVDDDDDENPKNNFKSYYLG